MKKAKKNQVDTLATSVVGFVPNHGVVIMAYLFMHVRIVIAFSTIVMAERFRLDTHKNTPTVDRRDRREVLVRPRRVASDPGHRVQLHGNLQVAVKYKAEFAEYRGKLNMLRYILLRLCILALLVVASIFVRDHFPDLRVGSMLTIVISTILGVSVTFYASKNLLNLDSFYKDLFSLDSDGATFPYCHEEYQAETYYARNSTSSTKACCSQQG
ncbi:Amino acid/auxin permease-like protein [Phytophthora cinnamomi]|uniref:Amino acid/auxin permease-like protein n=1 Tax=Phytophthora cinnamomi TaxID=4785 RepID=UPI00355A0941|nr:Amino acid/auxin permease-like protein [Phytophthora cinnamomi]